jgi:hypothetical protein
MLYDLLSLLVGALLLVHTVTRLRDPSIRAPFEATPVLLIILAVSLGMIYRGLAGL